MDELEVRLANCFLAIFPELSADEVTNATSETVRGWDSVAGVTLLAVVEEEFGTSLDTDDPSQFDSYQAFLRYFRETRVEDRP
jgi:acyl carrier protein